MKLYLVPAALVGAPKKFGATTIEMLITTTFVILVALVIAPLLVRP